MCRLPAVLANRLPEGGYALSCHALSATIWTQQLIDLLGRFALNEVVDLGGGRVSVYRVTEVIGTSTESWEDAAAAAVKTAAKTLRDLRVAEVAAQDLHIDAEGAITYRTKLRLSFKYESEA
jgi:dodecin